MTLTIVLIVLIVVGSIWLSLVVLALGLCLVSARARRRAGLLVHPTEVPRQRPPADLPARDRIPPSSGASGAA